MISFVPRKDVLVIAAVSLYLAILLSVEGYESPAMFFLSFGFIMLAVSGGRSLKVDDYRITVRKKGTVFVVEVFKGGERVWREKVYDYAEFGDFAFDVKGGRVEVVHRGEIVGTLP